MTLNDFTKQTLEFPDDYEGKVIAIFIRSNKNIKGRKSVLYIHGFNDYFFHPHLAQEFHNSDYNFFALDLRKYGRSLLPHQHPNYCKDISEYYEEITESLQIISKENGNDINCSLPSSFKYTGLICIFGFDFLSEFKSLNVGSFNLDTVFPSS